MLETELSANLVLDSLLVSTSAFYEKANAEGLVDSFSYEFSMEEGYGFAMVGSDTDEPERLEELIRHTIKDAKTNWPVQEEDLDRMRRKKIGQFMRSLNSIEFIANQYTRYEFNDMNLFDVVPTLENLSMDKLKEAFATFSDDSSYTIFKECHRRHNEYDAFCTRVRGLRRNWGSDL